VGAHPIPLWRAAGLSVESRQRQPTPLTGGKQSGKRGVKVKGRDNEITLKIKVD